MRIGWKVERLGGEKPVAGSIDKAETKGRKRQNLGGNDVSYGKDTSYIQLGGDEMVMDANVNTFEESWGRKRMVA